MTDQPSDSTTETKTAPLPDRRFAWVDRGVAYHLVDMDRPGWFTRCRLPVRIGSRVADAVPGDLELCVRCEQASR